MDHQASLTQSDGALGKGIDKVPASVPAEKKGEEPVFPVGWKKKAMPAHMRPVTKFSSTSSLFLDSTISKPKNAELVHCIAEYIYKLIKPSESVTREQDVYEIFNETLHPLTTKLIDPTIPEIETIEKFIKNIFKIGQLAAESLIMGVAYADRVMQAGFKFYPFNYKRLMLAALILASKVWEDQAVWNVDFLELFPLATPNDLGQLEKKILSLLSFDVSITASHYARIYFDLRAQSSAAGELFSELKPLNKDGETSLELKTSTYTQKHTKKLHRSSGSVDDITTKVKSPRVILN
eukprot:TRINITY_DN20014_c0_g1_i1.p1 TRINITY_DN20014_c0_g1~~TRINITY_DN20014_c0_g1_i1.p1  ORF type:complete len:294 (+),score=88.52 TRINITY_DN20014_c0_g1_i1:168-1049(+)